MSRRRILVVDDDDDVLVLVGVILGDAGYEVGFAQTGRQAIEQIHDERPDLVILDLMMPDLDGVNVIKQLGSEKDPPPVVVLTAHGDYEGFTQKVRDSVAGYMSKPFSFPELVATCGRLVSAA